MDERRKNIAIILAGGLGKRMNSDIPKVINIVHGKPMIIHLLEKCNIFDRIFIVVGKYYDIIRSTIENEIKSNLNISSLIIEKIEYVMQMYPLGTGHAILCAKGQIDSYMKTYNQNDIRCVVLSGDVPFISQQTIIEMLNVRENENTKIIVAYMDNPFGYGRIICKNNDIGDIGDISDINSLLFERIVEEKDATDEEKNINLVNCGIYSFDCLLLMQNIGKLSNKNKQKEYYLTDMISLLQRENSFIELFLVENKIEILGINSMEQLLEAEKYSI